MQINRDSVSQSGTESNDDESDYIDQLPPALLNRKNDRKYRGSVSAEAFGKFNIKKEFIPPVTDK